MSRTIIDDLPRLRPRDLIAQAKWGGTTQGTWRGYTWTLDLNPHRSTCTIGGRQWELVPSISPDSGVPGARWFFKSTRNGRRGRWLLLTPTGDMGIRAEIMRGPGCARHASQRQWSEARGQALQRHKVLRQLGMDMSIDWCVKHPDYIPKKPKWMKRVTYSRLLQRLRRYQ